MTERNQYFKRFLEDEKSLSSLTPVLKALWYDGNGDWEKAHDQVDSLEGKDAARIHAYLHRKEGDQWNADYWYRRAGEVRPNLSLDEEWQDLLSRFLN
ncbi:hypothetical protein SAMN04489724_0533 [Algoriphagus locisalis]|uniref:Uncharacterized protein n=1 Tax=Algoriphagus locisalis TaxID=305507 RepID=A0A1I6XL18_9BACT|nr:hypothetical protein [Algoriphagus locisalis]SFT38731.1 hypothetical protein SAMN04489724_0533 [Algoriphagus locisalis]